MYEITGLSPDAFPDDIERFYEDPRSAQDDLSTLRYKFPEIDFSLLKDGIFLDEGKLDGEIKSYEIRIAAATTNRVPTGYRRGWGSEKDDFASDGGGVVRVWRPPNPEESGD